MRGTARCHVRTALTLSFLLARSVAADSPPRTEQAIANLEAALAHDSSVSPEVKAALLEVVEALRAERAPAAPAVAPHAPSAPLPEPTPAARVSGMGDFRLRQEWNLSIPGKEDQPRTRLRVRAGLAYAVSDEVTVGGQLRTGNLDDIASPHTTLGNLFRTHTVSLEQATLRYRPKGVPGLALTGGKMAHPFLVNPVYGEVAWDADVRPEGVAVGYRSPAANKLRVSATAGGFLVLEEPQGRDVRLWEAQTGVQREIGGAGGITGALGFQVYTNTDAGRVVGANPGNAAIDEDGDGLPDRFASGFRVLNPMAAFRHAFGGVPLTLSAEWIHNTEAVSGLDSGWVAGVSVGSLSKPWHRQAYYQFLNIERDALFALVAQDDFQRRTDLRGHVAGFKLKLLDKAQVHAWVLTSRPEDDLEDHGYDWRARMDLDLTY